MRVVVVKAGIWKVVVVAVKVGKELYREVLIVVGACCDARNPSQTTRSTREIGHGRK